MGIRMGGQKPGDLGPPFRKRNVRHNASHGFKFDGPFDSRTGKDVPLVNDPKDQAAQLEVLEVHLDYLVCEGLNPYTKRWMSRALVAKPYLLRVTPFDGKSIQVEEKPTTTPPTYSTISYVYDEFDKDIRVATTTTSSGEVTIETQTLSHKYFVQDVAEMYEGDIITAIRTSVVAEDGSQALEDTGLIERNDAGEPVDQDGNVIDENDAKPIVWLDLNSGARRWPSTKQILKLGKTVAEIVVGDTGTINVWREGVDTGETIEAELAAELTNQNISAGKGVIAAWFADENEWKIIAAECEDPQSASAFQVTVTSEAQALTTTFADIEGMMMTYTAGPAIELEAPP